MNWTFVSSKNINSIGHDPLNNELHIEYTSGKTYAYENVNAEEYVRIVSSERPSKEAMDSVQHKKYKVIKDNGL